MRFHIGFSKRIKFKTLIEILGFLFVGVCAFFGFTQQGYAWTMIPQSQFTGKKVDYLDTNSELQTTNCTGLLGSYPSSNDSGYCLWYDYYSSGKYRLGASNYNSSWTPKEYGMFQVAQSQGHITNNRSNSIYTQDLEIFFNNGSNGNGYCPNNTTDLKSVNFKFYFSYNPWNSAYDYFNLSNVLLDNVGVKMSAYDTTTDPNNIRVYTNACEVTNLGYNYQANCNNIFNGNSNYTISYYSIIFENISPFNDRYSSSTEDKAVTFEPTLQYRTSSYSSTDNTLQYECNEDEPVFEPICNPGECDDDENGLNDIYVYMQDNFDSSIPGIDSTKFVLNLPNTITDLVSMPFDLVRAIVDNSTNNACQTYDIDFSSILHKWGGGNNNDTYILHLPCMRSLLSDKLGSTFYTILDSMIAFYLFYNMVMFFISMLDAVTSGQDLYSYFFKDSEDEMLVSTYDGSYTRKKHWYE